jgi:3-methylfumaryl-CoA hydratase
MSEDFSAWIGRSEQIEDVLEPARTNALGAALGQRADLRAGDALPLLHHWLYFWDVRPPEGVGVDGHPVRGGFMPPVAAPRRMWAGGRLQFLRPLRIGHRVWRDSTILSVETKHGRTGQLTFVTVEHVLSNAEGRAIVEQQDIVYREAGPQAPLPPMDGAAPVCAWRQDLAPDPVLLFRYSALTMNGHRIHYDHPYATTEEGYPALVVQGPLQATLLLGLAANRLERPITAFEFRGQGPAYNGLTLRVCGEPTDEGAKLWTEQGGRQSMVANATCSEAH